MDKFERTGDKMQRIGKKLTKGLTVPVILFVIGVFTMPFGLIFCIAALILFFAIMFGDDK